MKLNFVNKTWSYLLLMIIPIYLSSCSKKDDNSPINKDNVKLIFNVVGIDEYAEDDNSNSGDQSSKQIIKNSKLLTSGNHSNEGNTIEDIKNYGGFDAILSFEENQDGDPGQKAYLDARGIKSSSKISNTASAMTLGFKYRVLVYKEDGTYLGAIDGSSGTTPTTTIPFSVGQKYKWVAYSFNNSTALPAAAIPPALPTTNFQVSPTTNKDLLYATGNLTTAVLGDNVINVTFKRAASRIRVKLDARGLFSKIQNSFKVTLNTGALKQGTFDLLSGDYGTLSNATNPTVTYLADNTYGPDLIYYADYYTAAKSATTQPLKVTLSSFRVTSDINDDWGYFFNSNGSNLETASKSFDFGNVLPVKGKTYNARVQMVDPPAVTSDGTKWARGNLYYDANRANDKYRIRGRSSDFYDTRGANKNQEYWNFNTLIPNGSTPGDPCAMVYPEGVWKTPTSTQLSALNSLSGTKYGKSEVLYLYWENSSTSPASIVAPFIDNAYTDNTTRKGLYLLALGYRQEGTGVILDYSFGNSGVITSYGYLRSSSSNSVFKLGVTHNYYTNISSYSGGTYGKSIVSTFPANRGAMIRCVRTK